MATFNFSGSGITFSRSSYENLYQGISSVNNIYSSVLTVNSSSRLGVRLKKSKCKTF